MVKTVADEIREMGDRLTALLDQRAVDEAGGYYTQPVYDLIEKHGYEKVMQNHTQIQRVDLIIEQWKKFQSR